MTGECGAGRLTAPDLQGLYYQSLPGPTVQQVLVGAAMPRQLTWINGSVEGVTWHHHSSVVQQEMGVHSTEGNEHEKQMSGKLFRIPRLKERYRALLVATKADWEREAVNVLKCRLCTSADFSDWEDFKRHCDAAEAHPVKISYCDHCGDFFARRDALKRHCDKPPREWISVTAEIADTKRRETNQVHIEFEASLERCLRTGEQMETPFAQVIKKTFPKSSKKGSREQSRLTVVDKSKPHTRRQSLIYYSYFFFFLVLLRCEYSPCGPRPICLLACK
jgi:hypothetical protein